MIKYLFLSTKINKYLLLIENFNFGIIIYYLFYSSIKSPKIFLECYNFMVNLYRGYFKYKKLDKVK